MSFLRMSFQVFFHMHIWFCRDAVSKKMQFYVLPFFPLSILSSVFALIAGCHGHFCITIALHSIQYLYYKSAKLFYFYTSRLFPLFLLLPCSRHPCVWNFWVWNLWMSQLCSKTRTRTWGMKLCLLVAVVTFCFCCCFLHWTTIVQECQWLTFHRNDNIY